MTDMCLRIDGLPHDTWGYTLLPFAFPFSRRPLVQGEQWAELHYPGCRFALPWAMSRLPFQGVLHLRGTRLWGKRAQGEEPLIRKNDNIKE